MSLSEFDWSGSLLEVVAVDAVDVDFLSGGGMLLGWLKRVGVGRAGVFAGVWGLGELHGGLRPFVSNLICRPGGVFSLLGFESGCWDIFAVFSLNCLTDHLHKGRCGDICARLCSI